MGIKNLSSLNKAFLCKWNCLHANERGEFWREVIKGKYGEEEGGWSSCVVRDGFRVGLWKPIRKLRHLVSSRFSFVVGDGLRVKFWKDKWCGDTPL